MSDDKPTSMLTGAQRRYLQGEHQPSNVSQHEGRIRDRIEAGLFDFYLLFEYLEEEELRKVFGTDFATEIEAHEEAQGNPTNPSNAPAYVPLVIAFFLRALDHDNSQIHPELEDTKQPQPAFERFIEEVEAGIQQYLNSQKNYTANVTVEIKLDDLELADEVLKDG